MFAHDLMARAALSDSFRRRAEAKRARSSSYSVTYLVTLHSGLGLNPYGAVCVLARVMGDVDVSDPKVPEQGAQRVRER